MKILIEKTEIMLAKRGMSYSQVMERMADITAIIALLSFAAFVIFAISTLRSWGIIKAAVSLFCGVFGVLCMFQRGYYIKESESKPW